MLNHRKKLPLFCYNHQRIKKEMYNYFRNFLGFAKILENRRNTTARRSKKSKRNSEKLEDDSICVTWRLFCTDLFQSHRGEEHAVRGFLGYVQGPPWYHTLV